MDGLTSLLKTEIASLHQHTLKTSIGFVGIGLHSGRRVQVSLLPAGPDTGIVFRRTDLGVDIPARYDLVADTRLCTRIALGGDEEACVGTIEHLMAAFAGCGIDNAVVALDGPEVPVLDGSAAPLVFLIDCAGREAQSVTRQAIEVLRTIRVENGLAFAELRPGGATLDMAMSIDFSAEAIGRQALSLSLTGPGFRSALANARTFTQLYEIEALQQAGLARGGSLDNAVVVDGTRVMNPGGLRSPDEFVRHKMLDAVGDLALAGAPLHARFVAHRGGHALNNQLLRALFADANAWRVRSLEPASGWSTSYVSAEAA